MRSKMIAATKLTLEGSDKGTSDDLIFEQRPLKQFDN
jgi:hypothetical protein